MRQTDKGKDAPACAVSERSLQGRGSGGRRAAGWGTTSAGNSGMRALSRCIGGGTLISASLLGLAPQHGICPRLPAAMTCVLGTDRPAARFPVPSRNRGAGCTPPAPDSSSIWASCQHPSGVGILIHMEQKRVQSIGAAAPEGGAAFHRAHCHGTCRQLAASFHTSYCSERIFFKKQHFKTEP